MQSSTSLTVSRYKAHGIVCPFHPETEEGQQCKWVQKYITSDIFASKIPGLASIENRAHPAEMF